ncbi:acetyl-CoA carboxylase carboxyl transferase subunit alpha, partial [Enterococcus faecalis]
IYAVLSPEGFASILWKDGSRAKEAAELMKNTATELKELAIVDKVIPEVMNGQPLVQAKINRMLLKAFISKLTELAKLGTETLL